MPLLLPLEILDEELCTYPPVLVLVFLEDIIYCVKKLLYCTCNVPVGQEKETLNILRRCHEMQEFNPFLASVSQGSLWRGSGRQDVGDQMQNSAWEFSKFGQVTPSSFPSGIRLSCNGNNAATSTEFQHSGLNTGSLTSLSAATSIMLYLLDCLKKPHSVIDLIWNLTKNLFKCSCLFIEILEFRFRSFNHILWQKEHIQNHHQFVLESAVTAKNTSQNVNVKVNSTATAMSRELQWITPVWIRTVQQSPLLLHGAKRAHLTLFQILKASNSVLK